MKRILITGADSYIGTSFEKWMKRYEGYVVDTVGTRNGEWKKKDFAGYDVVFHVAGIAHVDAKKSMEALYYKVNRDLAISVAKKAKREGVIQFIFMSSMIVYGNMTYVNKVKYITKDTVPRPANFYGNSKLEAEKGILALESEDFRVVIVRPPMVYGKDCKGNYQKLVKLAKYTPIFFDFRNKRSMLHIDNLCEFVKLAIEYEEKGVFVPQNKEYVSTSEMVKLIAKKQGKDIRLIKIFNLLIWIFGDRVALAKKVFGNFVYDKKESKYMNFRYCVIEFVESLE